MNWDAFATWWGTVDWETAPDWFAAIGTVGTVLFAVWSTRREGKRHRKQEARERIRQEQLEEQQRLALAEPVSFEIVHHPEVFHTEDGKLDGYRIAVHNASGLPIYDAGLIREEPYLIGSDRRLAHITAEPVWNAGQVPAGQSIRTTVVESVLGRPPLVALRFRDARHQTWLRSNNGGLQHISDSAIPSKQTGPDSPAMSRA